MLAIAQQISNLRHGLVEGGRGLPPAFQQGGPIFERPTSVGGGTYPDDAEPPTNDEDSGDAV